MKRPPNQSPDPTAQQIAAVCEEIRRGWSPREERHRRGWSITGHVIPGIDRAVKVAIG